MSNRNGDRGRIGMGVGNGDKERTGIRIAREWGMRVGREQGMGIGREREQE